MKKLRHILFLFVGLLILSAGNLEAQNKKVIIDSLKTLIPTLPPAERFDPTIRLSKLLLRAAPDQAVTYAEDAVAYALQSPFDTVQIRAFQALGQATFRAGEIHRATRNFESGLEIAEQIKHAKYTAYLENNLAIAYFNQGKYENALRLFFNALEYWNEQGGKPSKLTPILINIASIYISMKQYDDAIGIYNRIMPLVEEIGSDSYLSSASNNLGDLYSQKGDYERALPYFKKALSLKVKLGQKMGTINTLANIGQLYTEQSRFDSASQYYNRALIMALQVGNKWAIQGLYSGLGDLYHKEGRYEQALLNYRFSLEGAQATQQLANIAKLKKSMAETFAAMGRHDSAFVYLQQYVGLQDTLFNEDMQRQIADMNAKYADKQREAEFQQLKSEKALQQFQLIFAILTSLFFVISSVALWIRFRDKKAANTLLSEQRDEIAQQNHLLRQSVSDLRQFAYVASHDLREPLRTIRSYLQLLKKRYSPHIEQSGQDFIEFAVEGAQRMDRLLRDLLLYSRIGRENQPLVEVDLNEVLEFVAGNLGQQIEENRATLLIEENLPVVEARETRMVQLFQNLVSNAIKFRREEPPVIRVSGRVQNGFAIISVRDNGIGIDPRFEEKIFTIFQRLHTQEAYEGTGIGLAICKRIAEQQGGEIWFESQLNEGTTFFVKLPLRIQGAFLDEHPSPQQIEEKA